MAVREVQGVFKPAPRQDKYCISMCLGLMLKYNNPYMEKMSYIKHCNDLPFNFYDI
jgi:hypothetical protein